MQYVVVCLYCMATLNARPPDDAMQSIQQQHERRCAIVFRWHLFSRGRWHSATGQSNFCDAVSEGTRSFPDGLTAPWRGKCSCFLGNTARCDASFMRVNSHGIQDSYLNASEEWNGSWNSPGSPLLPSHYYVRAGKKHSKLILWTHTHANTS